MTGAAMGVAAMAAAAMAAAATVAGVRVVERAAAARVEAEVEMASTLPELHKYRCSGLRVSSTSQKDYCCRRTGLGSCCTTHQYLHRTRSRYYLVWTGTSRHMPQR